MLFGGRAAFFPENENTIRESQAILRRDMVRIFPQLADTKIDYVWGGTLDFAFDMMPHVGKMDGLYYSVGIRGPRRCHGYSAGAQEGARIASGSATPDANPVRGIPFKGARSGLSPQTVVSAARGNVVPFLDIVS